MKQIFNTLTLLALICSISCFSCPDGKTAKDNNVVVDPNGCGPAVSNLTTKITSAIGNYFGNNFEGSCNEHDKCYGKCGSDKKECDSDFHSCMKSKCNKKNVLIRTYCKAQAKIFFELVDEF